MLEPGPLLGASMAISIAIALHALLLRRLKAPGVTDLDSLATFQILAVCVYSSMPFIIISRTARQTPIYFILIMFWACICFAAMFCAVSAAGPSPEIPCIAYNTTAGLTIGVNATSCAAACLEKFSPFREVGSALHQFTYTSNGMIAVQIVGCTLGGMTLLVGFGRLGLAVSVSDEEAEDGENGIYKALTFGPPLCIIGGGLGFVLQLILGEVALHRSGIDYLGPFDTPGQWMPWVGAVATMVGTGLVYALQGTRLGGPKDESTES
jgi:hypothetical protein